MREERKAERIGVRGGRTTRMTLLVRNAQYSTSNSVCIDLP